MGNKEHQHPAKHIYYKCIFYSFFTSSIQGCSLEYVYLNNRQRAARHQENLAKTAAPLSSTPSTASGEASVTASVTAASLTFSLVAPTTGSKTVAEAFVSDPSSETESADKPVEGSSINFKCDQCSYTNVSRKGLEQHIRMKHRIS